MKISDRMVAQRRLKIMRELIHAKHLESDTISTPLFHFTKESGLKGILESNRLLFTDFKNLNDEYEFSFLKNYIFKTIETMANGKNKDIADFFVEHFDSYLKDTQLYTTSFCKNKENNVLWQRYALNGEGYALGFSEKLFEFTKKTNHIIKPDWPIVFLKVHYGEKTAKKDTLAFIKLFLKLLEDKKYRKYKNYANMSFEFESSIFAAMPRYKSSDWETEEEYRFFMMNKGQGHKIPIEKGERPYIDGIVTMYLSEIIIGPKANLRKKDIEAMLKESNYEISKINIQYFS